MRLLDWILGPRHEWKLHPLEDNIFVPYYTRIKGWQGREMGTKPSTGTPEPITKRVLRDVSWHFNQAIFYVPELMDYWPVSVEAVVSRAGDCDDQAIAKYGQLRWLGAELDRVWLVIARNESDLSDHMACAYYDQPDNPWVLIMVDWGLLLCGGIPFEETNPWWLLMKGKLGFSRRKKMKKLFWILAVSLLLCNSALAGQDIKFTWDPYTSDPIVGFKLYMASAPNVEVTPINLVATIPGQAVTAYTQTNVPAGIHYWVLTAFTAALESGKSNEVTATVQLKPPSGVTQTVVVTFGGTKVTVAKTPGNVAPSPVTPIKEKVL